MSKTKASGPGHYEILFIIANEYTEKEAKKISQDVENIISKYKGEITYKEFWGKKKLAYPIKHNHFGYYSLLEFDLETKNLPELNENLRLFNKIIRFQIIRTKKRTLEEINAEKAKQEALSKNKEDKDPQKTSKKEEITNASAEKENKEEITTKEKEDKRDKEDKEEKKETKKEKDDNLKDLDDKLDNILDAQDLIK